MIFFRRKISFIFFDETDLYRSPVVPCLTNKLFTFCISRFNPLRSITCFHLDLNCLLISHNAKLLSFIINYPLLFNLSNLSHGQRSLLHHNDMCLLPEKVQVCIDQQSRNDRIRTGTAKATS